MTLNLEAIKARCERATAAHTCTETSYGCLRCQSETDSFDAECLLLIAEVERLRKVEAAVVAMFARHGGGDIEEFYGIKALRAALDAAQGGG